MSDEMQAYTQTPRITRIVLYQMLRYCFVFAVLSQGTYLFYRALGGPLQIRLGFLWYPIALFALWHLLVWWFEPRTRKYSPKFDPKSKCLHCDYSLAGLPPRSRCPECGKF